MRGSYNYRASIESDEDGCHVVSLPDFGWSVIDGATLAEAWGLQPEPSPAGRRRPLLVPPVETALKAALCEAWRAAPEYCSVGLSATSTWRRAKSGACCTRTTPPRRR